jgi:hypothetical protein
MSQNTEETINNKIELSISNENNNIISEENNSFNIINKESNDYIKLSNSIEGKKVNLMKRIEYIDIIETIAIFLLFIFTIILLLELQVWLIYHFNFLL